MRPSKECHPGDERGTMHLGQRIFWLFAILFGSVGCVVCVAAIVSGYRVSHRLGQATESVFQKIDASLVSVGKRMARTQQRVNSSKISSEEIVDALKDWTRREAGDRLAIRLETAEKTERIGATLQQADDWLEISQSSVNLVQHALSIGRQSGAPVETPSVDALLEEIESLRQQLTEATELVARIHQRTTDSQDEKTPGERIEQAVQLTLRVVATLGSLDARLETFEKRLSQARDNLQGVESKTHRRLRVVTVCVILLLAWMAAGQMALFRLGWISLAPYRNDTPTTT
jgi:flagellin-like hook-associated protein FlgL